ncbi:MAG: RNA polymerase sigma factor [Proteobacteria bacterium]|nr:RNA polymerase sigma factor [Pseudomonadota bacterium]
MNPLSSLVSQRKFKQQLEVMRPRLYRMAHAWCHNPDLADDLVQETMVKALRNKQHLRDRGAMNSWLFSILRNCWCDHYRRLREVEDIENLVLVDHKSPAHYVEQNNVVDRVRAAIASLPAGQCQVMTLVDLEGMTYNDVAAVMDIPIGTVMSRLCRARRQLAELLLEFKPETGTSRNRLRRVK